jgi:hypothetical protein
MKAYRSRIILTGLAQPPKAVRSSNETKKLVVANPNRIGYIEPKLVDDTNQSGDRDAAPIASAPRRNYDSDNRPGSPPSAAVFTVTVCSVTNRCR